MDRFADRLVARGPTLSADGETHTGSVHIVSAADLVDANRFASDEPYAQAGLYSSVTVTPWQNGLGGSMWDHPAPSPEVASTLVLARWSHHSFDPASDETHWQSLTHGASLEGWIFGGLLLTADQRGSVGLVFATDFDVADTARRVASLPVAETATSITCQRWCRGGRRDA